MEFLSAPAWLIIIINGHGLNSNVQISDPHWLRQISYFVKTAFQGSNVPDTLLGMYADDTSMIIPGKTLTKAVTKTKETLNTLESLELLSTEAKCLQCLKIIKMMKKIQLIHIVLVKVVVLCHQNEDQQNVFTCHNYSQEFSRKSNLKRHTHT